MKNYNLIFKGYWVEGRISNIPHNSGIYLVYRCTCDDDGVILKELLYIGQAENLHDRINNHDKKAEFLRQCQQGEVLCYSVAEEKKQDLDIIENALIYAQQPRLNDKCKDSFNYETPVAFQLEGRCKLMKHLDFTINN